MKRAPVILGLCLALALSATGCRRGKPAKAPAVEVSPRQASVTVKASGAVAIDFRKTVRITRIVSDAPQVQQTLRLLSVATEEPQSAGGRRFKVGLTIFGFAGAGTYRIAAPAGATPGAGLPSTAFLELYGKDRAPIQTFKRPAAPCTARIQGRGEGGTLTCPDLQDAAGAAVNFTFTWTTA